MHSKCLLQIMRQTNSCLNQTMSSLLACCSDVSRQRHTMRAKSRQDISALGGYRRLDDCLAAWLDSDSSDFYGTIGTACVKGETGSDFRSRCGLQQFSAFSCLLFAFAFVFGFLFFRIFLLCFFLAIFHATCANFLRDGAWMMQR